MRNSFAGTCYRCGLRVEPGDGHFERPSASRMLQLKLPRKGWLTQHDACAIKYRGSTHSINNPVGPIPGLDAPKDDTNG